jgi:hypothetical protein
MLIIDYAYFTIHFVVTDVYARFQVATFVSNISYVIEHYAHVCMD